MTDLLIENGRVFDLDGDVDVPPLADVLIRNGRIESVAANIAAPVAIPVIDASGQLLIPGLINTHYHSHDVLLRGLFEQMPLDVWGFYSGPGNYPSLSVDDIRLRTLLGAADCLVNGVTTLQDMVTIPEAGDEQLAAILSGYAASGSRVSLGLQISDKTAAETVPYWNEIGGALGERLRRSIDVRGLQNLVERTLSRTPPDRMVWALAPSGPQRNSDAVLAWVSGLAREHRAQVFTHVYEARSQAVIARLTATEGSLVKRLDRFGLLGPGLTIAHGVWIDESELKSFGAAGANLAFNPVSNMKLLNGFAPIRGYVDYGANIALGCDNCSGNDSQSLLQSMKLFALYWGMQSEAGETGAARRAFHAATLGGARALGLEGQIGALKPGFSGDVLMLDLSTSTYRPLHSALNQVVYGETGQSITTVIVGGKIVVKNGALVDHPTDKLKAQAEDARARMKADIDRVARDNADIMPVLLDAYRRADAYPMKLDRYSMRFHAGRNCGCSHE